MRQAFAELYKGVVDQPGRKLNLGCALNPEPGYVNLDCNAAVNPDVVWDLNFGYLPFPDTSFELILASHCLEHIEQPKLTPLMNDLWRVLSPGGALIICVPYATSFVAFECPLHRQLFTENTFSYWTRAHYQGDDAGHGATQGLDIPDFSVERVMLIPHERYRYLLESGYPGDRAKLETLKNERLNVIQEVQAVMRKPRG